MAVLDDMEGGAITQRTIDHLNKTTGWMKFFSILGLIILGIVTILLIIGIGRISQLGIPLRFNFFGIVTLLIWIGSIAGYIYACVLLLGHANKLTELSHTKSPSALEQAMDKQRQYWLVHGILFIVNVLWAIIVFAVAR
ncbi:MAG: DUF5362 family protein [Saprospiraceae bacterium]|nr:DUF5362 family protein [Saprospiraceae bacterium]